MRAFSVFFAVLLLCLTACACEKTYSDSSDETTQAQATVSQQEEEAMQTLEITVGGSNFSVRLYENEAVSALRSSLPLTLEMHELNGNEKYCYMDFALPTVPFKPGKIQTGDLMLYGNSCIVLFYESFSTAYSYTPLGRVENPQALAEALGSGSATVTFR